MWNGQEDAGKCKRRCSRESLQAATGCLGCSRARLRGQRPSLAPPGDTTDILNVLECWLQTKKSIAQQLEHIAAHSAALRISRCRIERPQPLPTFGNSFFAFSMPRCCTALLLKHSALCATGLGNMSLGKRVCPPPPHIQSFIFTKCQGCDALPFIRSSVPSIETSSWRTCCFLKMVPCSDATLIAPVRPGWPR